MLKKRTRWRKVPGFNNYEISDVGQIRKALDFVRTDKRSYPPGKSIRLQLQGNGYFSVSLMAARGRGQVRTVFIHVALAKAFHGPKPSPKHVARHLDDNKRNNTTANVKWGTFHDNEADKKRNGNTAHGTKNGLSKLTIDQVRELRLMRKNGSTACAELAEKIKVSASTAWRCASVRTYAGEKC